jgi:hypothetical protein
MLWGEVSKWAKEKGYKISRKDGNYVWVSTTDPNKKGEAEDLEDIAKAVFNQITDNKWLEYQKKYIQKNS